MRWLDTAFIDSGLTLLFPKTLYRAKEPKMEGLGTSCNRAFPRKSEETSPGRCREKRRRAAALRRQATNKERKRCRATALQKKTAQICCTTSPVVSESSGFSEGHSKARHVPMVD